ncbi:MAG: ABC transporter ATP-binding protein, partial [Caldilineaceae bacterium]|nr:ABC transporter ATP-binding protein [Caldilineaceae bacterium]
NDTFVLLLVVAATIVVIALLQSTFGYLENYMTMRAGYQLVNTLRRELFLQFQRLPLTFHQESKRGELVFNVADDAQTVRDAFTDSALSLVTQVLTIIGMFVIMFYVNWRLALIPLLTFPLLFVVYHVLQRRLKQQVRKLRKKEGQIASQLVENLAIMPVIQAFGREEYEAERFAVENNQNLESGIRIAQLGAALNRTIAIVSEVGLAVVVFLGAWMALRGTMTPGDVLIFITYVRTMYKPVRQMVKLSTKLNSAWVAGQRIAQVLDMEPEIHDQPDAIVAQQLRGAIEFERVAFHYKAEQPVLYNVNFHIQPGQRVALVGPSGAGKSTITSLLLRLYDPRVGTIRIDGID